MSVINQKEYLKKYLGKSVSGKKKKKLKKVKSEDSKSRLTIIDDNIDAFNCAVQEDLLGESEDAPQIVEVIDDTAGIKSNTHLWVPIGVSNDNTSTPISSKTSLTISFSNKKNDQGSLKNTHLKSISKPLSGIEDDSSPPRKQKFEKNVAHMDEEFMENNCLASGRLTVKEEVVSPDRMDSDGDLSPRRKTHSNNMKVKTDVETLERSMTSLDNTSMNRDLSPPRKSRSGNEVRSSRWSFIQRDENSDSRSRDIDLSPPRKRHSKHTEGKFKIQKTLDGKTAGLQNANELVRETKEIKKREEETFKRMSSDVTGVNASTIVRDRKTGRIRNMEEETIKELAKKQKEDENKAKYSRWGKGLRQVEDATTRLKEELNEMNKPFARYADDEDLERHLKEQEREGDPMLAYIRKKKKKKDIEEGKPVKPMYMGEFMPNRYGIIPGHRWDGVDRSNGYEKQLFEVMNSKLAQQEESYQWSTADM